MVYLRYLRIYVLFTLQIRCSCIRLSDTGKVIDASAKPYSSVTIDLDISAQKTNEESKCPRSLSSKKRRQCLQKMRRRGDVKTSKDDEHREGQSSKVKKGKKRKKIEGESNDDDDEDHKLKRHKKLKNEDGKSEETEDESPDDDIQDQKHKHKRHKSRKKMSGKKRKESEDKSTNDGVEGQQHKHKRHNSLNNKSGEMGEEHEDEINGDDGIPKDIDVNTGDKELDDELKMVQRMDTKFKKVNATATGLRENLIKRLEKLLIEAKEKVETLKNMLNAAKKNHEAKEGDAKQEETKKDTQPKKNNRDTNQEETRKDRKSKATKSGKTQEEDKTDEKKEKLDNEKENDSEVGKQDTKANCESVKSLLSKANETISTLESKIRQFQTDKWSSDHLNQYDGLKACRKELEIERKLKIDFGKATQSTQIENMKKENELHQQIKQLKQRLASDTKDARQAPREDGTYNRSEYNRVPYPSPITTTSDGGGSTLYSHSEYNRAPYPNPITTTSDGEKSTL